MEAAEKRRRKNREEEEEEERLKAEAKAEKMRRAEFLQPNRNVKEVPEFEVKIEAEQVQVSEKRRLYLREEAKSSTSRTRQPPLERDRLGAHERLVQDYFCENPLYDDGQLKRRFRLSRRLFVKISNDFAGEFPFFTQRVSASRKVGFSGLQKCTTAIRQLAYDTASDAWDEYLSMSSRMCRESLENFCEGVISLYGRRYLRMPTAADVPLLYEAHQCIHGFPGMLGSLDFTHWEWAACPTAWKGQHHRGDHDGPTLILQVVASQDLWIWHAYFDMAGANNNIVVLMSSNLFDDVIDGVAPDTSFYANDVEYKYGYYLTDGIYPEWATLVKTLSCPDEMMKKDCISRKTRVSKKRYRAGFRCVKKKMVYHRPAVEDT
ncbi:uncharacterized protein LOC110880490 [Helianthus annuus]|uniref:uncharacterized protein LOC110880490 n=1 Tax=Helianthus annuus TaxID=4232 RepID=UPI000B905EC8|nr:uncharacterized protein LOC110880490 [Helianthus annuus]